MRCASATRPADILCGDLRENPDRVVSAYITVKWPTRAGDPASGDVLVGYRLWGDRPAAQTVTLTGTPAQVGGWLWRFTCPKTEQQVQAVYLAPGGDSFVSRKAAGLKYRRTTPADRYLRRCFKLMQKAQDRSSWTGDRQTARHERPDLRQARLAAHKRAHPFSQRCPGKTRP